MLRIGRSVPTEAHISTHIDSLITVKEIKEHYKNDNRVSIRIIDNSLGKGMVKEINFEEIKKY